SPIGMGVRPDAKNSSVNALYAGQAQLGLPDRDYYLVDSPKNREIVAYCRGPFCLMAKDAVVQLRSKGYQAFHLSDGVAEWRARGLPVAG
ncbi:MAG: ArsR family transcriptional regulator, partial [Curvibacter sp.]